MFVGRTKLLELIRALTEVRADAIPPVLVVEGCGGSGKTALLRETLTRWHRETPTVLVNPRERGADENSAVRPVIAAVMLGLSLDVPGYPISFERVLLAQIAIRTELGDLDRAAALELLNTQTNRFSNRTLMTGLINDLFDVAGTLISLPAGMAGVATRMADHLISLLERARRTSNFRWSTQALEWFGHQDQRFELDPDQARLQLSFQARSEDPDVRRGVDDLLVAALLADLRHSLARMRDREHNVLVLLDNGDEERAASFVGALLRVRQAVADAARGRPELPDPLLVVTTSNGLLADELADDRLPAPKVLVESSVDVDAAKGFWVRIRSEDLAAKDVTQIAKGRIWPPEIAAATIGRVLHGLSSGHPGTVEVLERRLRDAPLLLHDPHKLLRDDDTGLLEPFVRDFGTGADDVQALITLSPALSKLEAQTLAPLLPDPISLDSPLYTSTTLWSPGGSAQQRLPGLVRYLGMRMLAARPAGDEASWDAVLGTLRGHAGGEGPRLRHSLLLGDRAAVAEELLESLLDMETEDWLTLFDVVTGDPNPRERQPESAGEAAKGTAQAHAFRLLGVVPAFDHDPCVTDPVARQRLAVHVAQGFARLADLAKDPALLLLRAQRYSRYGRNNR